MKIVYVLLLLSGMTTIVQGMERTKVAVHDQLQPYHILWRYQTVDRQPWRLLLQSEVRAISFRKSQFCKEELQYDGRVGTREMLPIDIVVIKNPNQFDKMFCCVQLLLSDISESPKYQTHELQYKTLVHTIICNKAAHPMTSCCLIDCLGMLGSNIVRPATRDEITYLKKRIQKIIGEGMCE